MPAPSSPAARLLADYGVRASDVAAVARTTPATLSRWLSGIYSHPETLPEVLSRFLDSDRVAEVIEAIPAEAGNA